MDDSFWRLNSLCTRARNFVLMSALIGLFTLGCLASASAQNTPEAGPVRLVRFSYISGNVSWRPDSQSPWAQAANNLPMRQGAEITISDGGRAELQFDDGSYMSLNSGTYITLRTLYSDADGEFTEVTIREGVVACKLRHERSVYQIDTAFCSVDSTGPSRYRVDANQGVKVRVQSGQVTIQGSQGKATLSARQYLVLHSQNDAYNVLNLPAPDTFDRWTSARYEQVDVYWSSPHRHYVPDNIALVCDNLDSYGEWHEDSHYGKIWCPREHEAGWRPYHHGHWTWCSPFGWTWVGEESWGWAPYHYGTWASTSYGWSWVPGPSSQYWCPAVVNFTEYNGSVAWCPLAPVEVHYPPTLSIGFSGGNWSAFFSIGGAAVYYPTDGGYCEPRPWETRYVNNTTYVTNNYFGGAGFNHNSYIGNHAFVSVNARMAAGASIAAVAAFGGRGAYRNLSRDQQSVFVHGRGIGAPGSGFAPVAGPRSVRPTALALSPARVLRSSSPVSRAILARSVYHAGAPIRSFAAAHQVLAAPPIAAVRRQPGGAMMAGRMPNNAPHGAPGQPGRMGGPSAMGMSPGQRAAMQARAALGMKTRAGQQPAPGARPGSFSNARPGMANAPRPNATGLSPAQRNAQRARMALGVGAVGAAAIAAQHAHQMNVQRAVQANQRASHQPVVAFHRSAAPRPAPVVRNSAPVRRNAPAVRNYAPQVRHYSAPVRRSAPAVRRYSAPVRRSAPQVRHYSAPMRRSAPQQRAPQQRAPQQRAPQQRAPQQRAPQQRAPQQRAPQQRAPQQRAPQQRAPQQRAPQQRPGGGRPGGGGGGERRH